MHRLRRRRRQRRTAAAAAAARDPPGRGLLPGLYIGPILMYPQCGSRGDFISFSPANTIARALFCRVRNLNIYVFYGGGG